MREMRQTIRSLAKMPGVTLLIVLTVALGVGANTAIFSIVHGVLLAPLPFEEPERLMALCELNEVVAGFCIASPPNAEDWKAQSRSFEKIGLGRSWRFALRDSNGTEGVRGAVATPELFEVFRFRPALGRLFLADDLVAEGSRVTVLSHRFWQERFGGDPGIVGESLMLDEESYTVVGVLSPGARIPDPDLDQAPLWTLLPFDPRDEEYRDWRGFLTFGRLRDQVTLDEARSEMATIVQRLAATYPKTNEGWEVLVAPLREQVVGEVRATLWIFQGAVALVLLIACTNVASLLLARSLGRQKELAVRAAIGARRGDLVRQVVVECLMLAVLGGGVGVFLAALAVAGFKALAPPGVPRLEELGVDGRVFVFALAASFLSGALFAVLPAWRALHVDLSQAMRGKSGDRRSVNGRNVLVVVESAMAMMLLVGAGLLARSFFNATGWEGGIEHSRLAAVSVFNSTGKYPEGRQVASLYERAVEELVTLPGVAAVGAASAGPLFGGRETDRFGAESDPEDQFVPSRWFDIGPRYFATLGLPILRGRDFNSGDRADTQPVAIVNQTLARRLWDDEDPIGRRVRWLEEETVMEVVGVVADVEPFFPRTDVEPEIYWPNQQFPRWATFLVLRSETDPASLTAAVRERLREVDSDVTLGPYATFEELMSRSLVGPRFNMLLLAVFAVGALLLAAGSIYGVISYSVSRRTQEIGMRMAMGARRWDILRTILGRGLALAGIGGGVGLAGAWLLKAAISGLLYGVEGSDAVSFLAALFILLAAAVLACYLPARRAAKVDPISAIRYE